MSAILGVYSLNHRPVQRHELLKMQRVMPYRGPDGWKSEVDGAVGFGHGMRFTTPESSSEQSPWRHPDSRLLITADARIDNREHLANVLRLGSDLVTRHMTDTQFILSAYLKWGGACTDHLTGSFAFAIWDERTCTLFCARDHIGDKPFTYYHDSNIFVFASAANAVAAHPLVSSELNEEKLADYLGPDITVDSTSTFYRFIHKLPPAHSLTLQGGKVTPRTYWELAIGDDSLSCSESTYIEEFGELVGNAVRVRLRSSKPIASMLSGGLDSSTVSALARNEFRKNGAPPLITISARSGEADGLIEGRYIDSMLGHGGMHPIHIYPDSLLSYTSELLKLEQCMEEPYDGGGKLYSLISLFARTNGSSVLLTGVDDMATMIPSSYPQYLLRKGQWRAAASEIRGLSTNYWDGYHSVSRLWAQTLCATVIPDWARRLKTRYISTPRAVRDSFCSDSLLRKVKLSQRLALYQVSSGALGSSRSAEQMCLANMRAPWLTSGIEYVERLGAYAGVEMRHPLMDKAVLEFSAKLPWWMKVREGRSKYILRKIAEPLMPREVAGRHSFEHTGWVFYRDWMYANAGNAIASINDTASTLRIYVDQDTIANLVDSVKLGYDHTVAKKLYHIYFLNCWLNQIPGNRYEQENRD